MRFAYDAAQCTGPWNCDLNFEKWLGGHFAMKLWVNHAVTLGPRVGSDFWEIVLTWKGALVQVSDMLQFIQMIRTVSFVLKFWWEKWCLKSSQSSTRGFISSFHFCGDAFWTEIRLLCWMQQPWRVSLSNLQDLLRGCQVTWWVSLSLSADFMHQIRWSWWIWGGILSPDPALPTPTWIRCGVKWGGRETGVVWVGQSGK